MNALSMRWWCCTEQHSNTQPVEPLDAEMEDEEDLAETAAQDEAGKLFFTGCILPNGNVFVRNDRTGEWYKYRDNYCVCNEHPIHCKCSRT